MTIAIFTARRLSLAIALAAGTALAPASAHAGFFDELFGGGAPAPQPQQVQPDGGGYTYDQLNQGYQAIPRAPRAKKKVAAAVDRKPVLQKTTDIMSDKTLRPGDAVMMKSGVHIFAGDTDAHHDSSDFVALDTAHHVSKDQKGQLVALDVAHRAPMDYAASTTTMLEGRSVGGRAISEGYKITDARGRSIRYVGP